ncbi:Aste57867_7423 [Aphanomyces stellatus]|uniref:Aste57867_7103 protein n=1 Tax=Aphanomyces stellatus TaxID=120398 RepID=A0A485KIB1_9STRA|nr:hypothetical protein As57867_007397 [Aphanomyces stellatus]KAF0705204.1 hypothetical protein As57867_007080 [Aphanomyces stellatus]VFT84038.1 Aste57867_7103 [Aphanomyces stellatus]VFT84336.1 Aste57867_7423 [Aphanomyces stellatus]
MDTSSVPPISICLFNACASPTMPASDKCEFHKHRDKCAEPGCYNQVYARSRCVRHGGKPPCQFPGCQGNGRIDGLCLRHAPGRKKHCGVHGCIRAARVQGKCMAHGSGLLCGYDQCTSYARVGGVCQRHRHGRVDRRDLVGLSSGCDTKSRQEKTLLEIVDKPRPGDLASWTSRQ